MTNTAFALRQQAQSLEKQEGTLTVHTFSLTWFTRDPPSAAAEPTAPSQARERRAYVCANPGWWLRAEASALRSCQPVWLVQVTGRLPRP